MILIIGGAWQGKTAYAREHFGEEYEIINGYHLRVKEQLLNGQDPMEEAKKLPDNGEKRIVISDEIGSGLVPMDAFEREYREKSGRVNCFLAQKAEQVIRVSCGIGRRIK